jgi:acyl-coenzyme A synthetase/AMP-(fatty) acid ligase
MQLNTFLSKENLFIENDGTSLSGQDFLDHVSFVLHFLEASEADSERVLIGDLSPFHFFSVFIACCVSSREIVLLPNLSCGSINNFNSDFDIYINQDVIDQLDETKAYLEQLHTSFLDTTTPISIFTSGSQGKPSKISKTLKQLLNECHALEDLFGSCELVLSSITPRHIYGVLFCGLWPLINNKSIGNFKIAYPEELISQMNMTKLSVSFVSSPAFLKRLTLSDYNCTSSPTRIFSSGGPLSYVSANTVNDIFNIYPTEIYGSTETGGIALRTQENQNSLWTCFQEVQIDLRKGCLHVESPFILEGEFQTNDLVDISSSGEFHLKGRSDRIFKIEEKRVSLNEIETSIKTIEGVDDTRCVVMKQNGRDIIACVVSFIPQSDLESNSKIVNVKFIRQHLTKYFDNILLPKRFRFLKTLPYNDQSKILSKDILKVFNDSE